MKRLTLFSLLTLAFCTGFTSCEKKCDPIIQVKEVKVEVPVRCKITFPERPELNLEKRTANDAVNVKGNSVIVDRRNLLNYSQELEVVLKACADD